MYRYWAVALEGMTVILSLRKRKTERMYIDLEFEFHWPCLLSLGARMRRLVSHLRHPLLFDVWSKRNIIAIVRILEYWC